MNGCASCTFYSLTISFNDDTVYLPCFFFLMLNTKLASPAIFTAVLASINCLALLYVINVPIFDSPPDYIYYISLFTRLVNQALRLLLSVLFSKCITFLSVDFDVLNFFNAFLSVLINAYSVDYTLAFPTYSSFNISIKASISSSLDISDMLFIWNMSIN